MQDAVIGIDVGTSSCKASAFDLRGACIARARVAYPTHLGPNGAASQSPHDWREAVLDALTTLAGSLAAWRIMAIGLSAQIGTQVLLDSQYKELHPAVTWQDGRSEAAAAEVWQKVDRAELARELRTWLPDGPAWPLARMQWLRQALPREFATAAHLAQPKDIIVHALTGNLVSDPSSWRGVAQPDGQIATRALDALDLPNLIPDLVDGTVSPGGLLRSVAERTGLPVGTPVAVGWNDFNASLLGIGSLSLGNAFDVGGTSEHVGVVTGGPRRDFDVISVPFHGVDTDLYTVYGVTSNAGSTIDWMTRTAGRNIDIDAALSATPTGADGLLFMPYLYGERNPIWDASASGALVGLRATHGADHIVRAMVEGIALNLRAILRMIPSDSIRAVRSTGGTAGSAGWNRVKASVLGVPIITTVEPDSSSLGAAITAAVGVNIFADVHEATDAMVHAADVFEPCPQDSERYDAIAADFTGLYPSLVETLHRLRARG
ncbi:xylulokinase [Demequina lutea]|uniref:Sugar (Pentulose or hexulose) kinase n=1 Tax=Demequina lutea TaxID=431489 RepID=A0A7Y9Z7Z2_9MICO|nr:FGGY family carbohydrate kinase [Demequina lutea]NYI40507.1 sugar (pentulose or hexulose) kinase [Demequina lutea]